MSSFAAATVHCGARIAPVDRRDLHSEIAIVVGVGGLLLLDHCDEDAAAGRDAWLESRGREAIDCRAAEGRDSSAQQRRAADAPRLHHHRHEESRVTGWNSGGNTPITVATIEHQLLANHSAVATEAALPSASPRTMTG